MELPCPQKLWHDAGAAFTIGAILSTLKTTIFIRRELGGPKGRLISYFSKIRTGAPKLGGSFATWGTLFSGFDCTLIYIRRKEDKVNPIIAGALTGAVLSARAGYKASLQAAVMGGIFIGCIEAVQHVIEKQMIQKRLDQQQDIKEHLENLRQEHENKKAQLSSGVEYE